MAITRLTVRNFKSFGRVDVDLRNFNIVVGANASGKSNLVDVFQFLKDIVTHGLDDAISVHGGPKALRNFNLDDHNTLNLRFETDDVSRRIFWSDDSGMYGIKTRKNVYDFEIRLHKKGNGFSIPKDEFLQEFEVVKLDAAGGQQAPHWMPGIFFGRRSGVTGRYEESKTVGDGSIALRNRKNGLDATVRIPLELPFKPEPSLFDSLRGLPVPPRSLLLESPFVRILDLEFQKVVGDTRLYDFDSKKPKQAVPVTGIKDLERDAGNLAVVLQPILARNSTKRRQFLNLVSDLLPFIDSIGIDTLTYNALLTRLTERRLGREHDLPASWASDGTISILALVTALYFQDSHLTIFEEPERNIHPHLIGRIVQMMKEASEDKQIIVTTHNPEVLRHANLEDILLVTRGSDGCSTILRPTDSDVVNTFLENDLGIHDLFVQNLLEI